MVVNEKGLLKAMKDAYKRSGYKVAAEEMGGTEQLMIAGPDWMVVVEKKNVPRKVLGLIAEHLGDIPDCGEAYQAAKDQTQTEIFDVAMNRLKAIRGAGEKERKLVSKTDITMGGYNLWQCHEDRKIITLEPELENILLTHGRKMYALPNGTMAVYGAVSIAYVEPMNNHWEDEKAKLDHLAQIKWVAM